MQAGQGEAARPGALRDLELEAEIGLVGELVVAATASERHLSVAEIDQALGLSDGGAKAAAP